MAPSPLAIRLICRGILILCSAVVLGISAHVESAVSGVSPPSTSSSTDSGRSARSAPRPPTTATTPSSAPSPSSPRSSSPSSGSPSLTRGSSTYRARRVWPVPYGFSGLVSDTALSESARADLLLGVSRGDQYHLSLNLQGPRQSVRPARAGRILIPKPSVRPFPFRLLLRFLDHTNG